MNEKYEGAMGCGFAILFFAFGLVQMAAGWIGIEDSFGWGWGVAAMVGALVFRFTIPIAIGAFLCATNVWDWHWTVALIFAAPALLFMVPAIFASLAGSLKR